MTRKDYVFISDTLRASKPCDASMRAIDSACVAWLAVCATFAHKLAIDNPRFDVVRFMAACGNVVTA